MEKSGRPQLDPGIRVTRTTDGTNDIVRLGYGAPRKHSFTSGDSWQSAERKSHHEEAALPLESSLGNNWLTLFRNVRKGHGMFQRD